MNHIKNVPLTCAFEQGSSVVSWSTVGIRSAFPFLRPKTNPSNFSEEHDFVSAPSDRLIEHYINWSGASPDTYLDEVPPHLFSQWSIPLVTRVLLQGRYALKDIVNQSCHVRVNARIPRGEKLWLSARLINLEEDSERVRFSVDVSTSTTNQPNAITALFNLVLIRDAFDSKSHHTINAPREHFREAGLWSADENDGFNFALLTGDFNPIHWIAPLAKRSNFGGKVLHGFASLSRTWELLQTFGREQQRIEEINVKFLRPIRLPSPQLKVLTSTKLDKDGALKLRVRSPNNELHLAGKYKFKRQV